MISTAGGAGAVPPQMAERGAPQSPVFCGVPQIAVLRKKCAQKTKSRLLVTMSVVVYFGKLVKKGGSLFDGLGESW
jgi:hypothetical protein